MARDGVISLPAAVLINLNIMLGAGIFINTVELSRRAGALGFLVYVLIALLMLPLIYSIAKLVNLYPDAGFYGYGAYALHPFVGFISAWSYFVGKLASAMLMIHVALSLVQQTVGILEAIPVILLDCIVLATFVLMNMLNVRTGSVIQIWFFALKSIPIFFSIFAGLFLLCPRNYALVNAHSDGVISSLPFVLYAISGFEAACSLSCKIKNAKRNAPRAIFISCAIWTCIASLYQLAFYGAVGAQLPALEGYKGIFPLLLSVLMPTYVTASAQLQALLYLAIASSALGSAYGILFSNLWNLHTLAHRGHTFFRNTLTRLNRFGLPVWCIVAEGCLCALYLAVTHGKQIPLQQTSALACSIAYTLSVISLIAVIFGNAQRRATLDSKSTVSTWIPLLALANCLLLVGSCVRNFLTSGVYPLAVFLFLLVIGGVMFVCTYRRTPVETEA